MCRRSKTSLRVTLTFCLHSPNRIVWAFFVFHRVHQNVKCRHVVQRIAQKHRACVLSSKWHNACSSRAHETTHHFAFASHFFKRHRCAIERTRFGRGQNDRGEKRKATRRRREGNALKLEEETRLPRNELRRTNHGNHDDSRMFWLLGYLSNDPSNRDHDTFGESLFKTTISNWLYLAPSVMLGALTISAAGHNATGEMRFGRTLLGTLIGAGISIGGMAAIQSVALGNDDAWQPIYGINPLVISISTIIERFGEESTRDNEDV